MKASTGRKVGKQYSSLFSKKQGTGHKRRFATPTAGQLALIAKAQKHTLLA